MVAHNTILVNGIRMFYREAGPETAPVLLLLHGFPSSSHMFRHLIPALADKYRVIAPDYPGFGYSEFRDCTFADYAELIAKFTEALHLSHYALYLQDYGAPIGLRLMLLHPERLTALIVQNGNAYEEGLSKAWEPIQRYWAEPTDQNRSTLRGWLTVEGLRAQYTSGLPEPLMPGMSPDLWTLDWSLLHIELQLDLFRDYRTNVDLYPAFQQFFRKHQPKTLITWGRHDPFFTVAGAEAYLRDLPKAELHLLDAGHFALETHCNEIAGYIREFLRS